MVARSKEGIPLVVSAPFNEESLSGREVRMEWKRPENARGVIVNYTLAADQVKFGGEYGSGWVRVVGFV